MVAVRRTSTEPSASITIRGKRINEGVPNSKYARGNVSDSEYAREKNILHRFRTYNYLFTLSACSDDGLKNLTTLRSDSKDYIIARSQGKVPEPVELGRKMSYGTQGLVESFNEKSSGRFDMFIDGVEIETVMGFSKGTNLTMATKINFEVFEPYSMNGFIEALQVSAAAAGHKQYLGAPYLLKLEFAGYLDNDKSHRLGKEGTRIFVMNITGIEIEVNELGTKYRCQAVGFSDMGFGDHLALKTNIQMTGKTVKEVLTSLVETMTENNKTADEEDLQNSKAVDEYAVLFPKKTDSGYDFSAENDIAKALISRLREDKSAYRFPNHSILSDNVQEQKDSASRSNSETRYNPGNYDPKKNTVRNKYAYDDMQILVQFPSQAKLYDIISAVIRDSDYGKGVLDKLKSGTVPDMVEYAHIGVKVIPLGTFNKRELRPVYRYEFIIFPYDMHYTRIPLYQHIEIDKGKVENLYVRRKYNYLFTGKNVDIRTFNLKFNRLYFQAYPQGFDKLFQQDPGSTADGSPAEKPESTEKDLNAPIYTDPLLSSVVGYGGNAGVRTYDAYDKMVKAMHDAILDNTDMVTCEIEILGDPYYLVTQGTGNQFFDFSDARGMTDNSEAAVFSEDIIVSLNFRNPEDIDKNTGFLKFNDKKVPFSGCFRVTKAMSTFRDGLFTQRLFLVRIPGQPVGSLANTSASSAAQQGTGIEWT